MVRATINDVGSELVKLGISSFSIDHSFRSIFGYEVRANDGDEIGAVRDLYVDDDEQKVRFLGVDAGGCGGLGERHFLIPMEIVDVLTGDFVLVSCSREKVAYSPVFEVNAIPNYLFQRDIHNFYNLPAVVEQEPAEETRIERAS